MFIWEKKAEFNNYGSEMNPIHASVLWDMQESNDNFLCKKSKLAIKKSKESIGDGMNFNLQQQSPEMIAFVLSISISTPSEVRGDVKEVIAEQQDARNGNNYDHQQLLSSQWVHAKPI